MDAKSKANFINSVAAGNTVPCPNCNAANKPESKNCATCGAAMTAASNTPAFASATEAAPTADKYVEPVSVFASGLPAWDIVPPQVMVRRR